MPPQRGRDVGKAPSGLFGRSCQVRELELPALQAVSLFLITNVAASLGRDAANDLFRVVCARHLTRSTVVVTNLPFKRWGEFLPSLAQAVASADRLIGQATILRFSGKPFRRPRDIFGAPLDDE